MEQNKKKMNSVDFHNPTDQMIKDAKDMGVDLNDSQTIELLEQMKNEQNGVGRTLKNIHTSGLVSPPITSQTRPTMMWLIKACLCLIVGCAFAIIYSKRLVFEVDEQ